MRLVPASAVLVLAAAAFAAPALAEEEFVAVCVERSEKLHPEMENLEQACTCVSENTTAEQKAAMVAAPSPDALDDDTKAVMKACGFGE